MIENRQICKIIITYLDQRADRCQSPLRLGMNIDQLQCCLLYKK